MYSDITLCSNYYTSLPVLGGTAHKAVGGVGEPCFPVRGVGGTTAVVRRATLSLYVVDKLC